jgi:hypothetical protein
VSSRIQRRIVEFWDWWDEHGDAVATAISAGTIAAWVPEITSVVHAINRGLAWELMPGSQATHALVVTSEGKAELIGVAEDWLTSGPPADATWEFHSARPPGPLDTLTVDGLAFDLAGVRSRWTRDEGREQLDIELWHPAWMEMSTRARWLSAQLFLDRLLGEADKQRWIGLVNTADAAGDGAEPASLRIAVGVLAGASTRQKWTTMRRRSADGRVSLMTMNEALKRIDHPRATWHLVVSVSRDPQRLEAPDAVHADDLVTLVEGQHANLVAVVADAHRSILHFVVDPSQGAVAAALKWAEDIGTPSVKATADPAWRFRDDLIVGR